MFFFVHVLYKISRARFKKENWERGAQSDALEKAARAVGGVGLYLSIAKLLVFLPLMFGFFGAFWWEMFTYGERRSDWTWPLLTVLFVLLGYALIVRPIVTKLGALASTATSAWVPDYALRPDGFELDFAYAFIGKRSASAPNGKVFIGFHEIDQLKALDYQEAQQYMRYEVGPDVRRAWHDVRDELAYMQGKIPRPRAYIRAQSGGKTLVIRGPELFYVLTVRRDDVSDLLHAYAASKK